MPWYTDGSGLTVIGVSGKARSGKDYLATQGMKGMGFMPMAFANHFKVDVVAKDGAEYDQIFGDVERTPEVRDLLQRRGTEEGREVYGHDVWLRVAEVWLTYFSSKGYDKFVFTDVRFPNEADWIHDLGGFVIRIVGRGGAESNETQQHISETALDDYDRFDVFINNAPDRAQNAVIDMRRTVESILLQQGKIKNVFM